MNPDLPALIASRYRPLRELGRGGMGVVYVVEHIHTGDQLALKLLHGQAAKDAESIERFKREARASARIKSEHVVKVLDADVAPELDGAPFLVMELLDGTDLQKLSQERGPIPPSEVFACLAQAARALDRSHSLGIIHRDLKPENLFLHRREDGSSIVKVLDFGISKFLGSDSGNGLAAAGMTHTGAVMGTPIYMAPEQARGRVSDIGPWTDAWAIGLIGLHLLTGEIYWTASTLAELMLHIVSDPPYNPAARWTWLPPAFDEWFARSTARDPAKRFSRVGEQVAAFGAAFGLGAERPSGPQVAAYAAPVSAPVRSQEVLARTEAAPWSPGYEHGVSPSAATALAGAQTTTGPTARERGAEPVSEASRGGRSFKRLVATAAAVLGLCALGGVGFSRWRSGSADPAAGARLSPETATSGGGAPSAAPAADAPRGGGGLAALPALALPAPSPQAPATVSAGAPSAHHPDLPKPHPAATNLPVVAAAPSPGSPVPPPAPRPTATATSTSKIEFRPSGL